MTKDRHLKPLGPVDAAFWYLDTDTTPMNIGSILIFEGKVDVEKVMALVDARLHEAPIYHQKVIALPNNMSEPFWVFDDSFFIENHFHHLHLSPDGSYESLRQLAGKIISTRLDRNKPLWNIYIIEGLDDGNTAVMLKVHHAMVDGVSAVDLLSLMLEPTDDIPEIPPKPLYDPPRTPTEGELWEHTMRQGVPYRMNMFKKWGESILELGTHLLDREQRKRTLIGMLSYIHDHLTKIESLPINGNNTGTIEIAWKTFDLKAIKRIGKVHRVSINDVMTTILGSAIAQYIEAIDADTSQPFVRLTVPVNLRDRDVDETDIGNRISFIPIEVPLNGMTPLERLEHVKRYSSVMKESELAQHMDLVLTLPAFAPSFTQPMIWGIAPKIFSALSHLWCTNVPGPQLPLYLLGHRMVEASGFFPLNPSMGMASVILSYNGMISISIIADKGIVPDVKPFKNYLQASFDHLIETLPDMPSYDIPADLPTTKHRNGKTPAADTSVSDADDEQTHTIEDVREVVVQTNTNTDSANKQTSKSAMKVTKPQEVTNVVEARLMSQAWAEKLQSAINNSTSYQKASTNWTAGQLAFIMKANPKKGYQKDEVVLLDLHKGICRSANNVARTQAESQATFVLEASYDDWMNILEKRAQPLPMIMRGKLKLAKGSLRQLMPFTKSSQELVKCAISIS
jgi:diacylglycerol O-acyltransferase